MGSLRYLVPNGQDTAVLVAALHKEGYAAEGRVVPEGHVVVVEFPEDTERERARVRATLQHATGPDTAYVNPAPPEVTFLDE